MSSATTKANQFAGWLATPELERARFWQACYDDPCFYAKMVLGVDLWEKQMAICRSVRDNPRTAVKSCHGSGKSFVAAVIANWFLDTRANSIVATTAPTFRQVARILWGEIRRLRKRAIANGFPVPGRMLGTDIKIAEKWYAFGFSTDDPDRVQGLHADAVLVILDEAPGISAELMPAIEGVLTGTGDRLLSIGNPTDAANHFAREYASLPVWARFTISAFDTPNLRAGRTVVKGLVTAEWVEDKRTRWGENSPMWQSRVLGDFPSQGTDTLIPLWWVERAQAKWEKVEVSWPVDLGVDVARFGDDDSVVGVRAGSKFWIATSGNGWDTMTTAERTRDYAIKQCAGRIKVDTVGIGGAVADRLRQIGPTELPGVKVIDVVASEGARDGTQFRNLKAEQFWALRERFERDDIAIDPKDTDLAAQLSALKYKISAGRIEIVDKATMKKDGLGSPDRAEACMIAFSETERSVDAPTMGAVPIAMPAMGGY